MADPRAVGPAVLVILAALLLAVAGIRARVLEMPLERDEGEYAYVGQRLLQGLPPYQLAYTMKLPGTAMAYAGSMTLFGASPKGIRLGLLLASAGTMTLLFQLGRVLASSRMGLMAAGIYGVLAASPAVEGLTAHATQFVVLPAVAGWLVLASAPRPPSPWRALAGGLLLGLAILAKQSSAFLALGGATAILTLPAGAAGSPVMRRGRSLAWCGVGMALPVGVTAAGLAAWGVWPRFWFWTVAYAREYARLGWAQLSPDVLRGAVSEQVAAAPFLWLVIAVGTGAVAVQAMGFSARNRRAVARFLLALAGASAGSVLVGGYLRSHYFVQALPAAALVAASGLEAALVRLERSPGRAWVRVLPPLLLLAATGEGLVRLREPLFSWSPEELSRRMYRGNAFPELAAVGRFLRDQVPAGARLAVLGSEPQLYFYADRPSVTGYLYMYGLTEPQRFAGRMQDELIREVESGDPDYVVVVGVALSWFGWPTPAPTPLFAWMSDYCRRRLTPVGLVDAPPGTGTRYLLGGDLASAVPASAGFIAVLARRPEGRPAPPICDALRPPTRGQRGRRRQHRRGV